MFEHITYTQHTRLFMDHSGQNTPDKQRQICRKCNYIYIKWIELSTQIDFQVCQGESDEKILMVEAFHFPLHYETIWSRFFIHLHQIEV